MFAGTPWSTEFLNRMERDRLWVSVNPFECTEITTDQPSSDIAWTAERSTFKNNSLRVVIKEEPCVESTSYVLTCSLNNMNFREEAPRPRLVLKFIKPKVEEEEDQVSTTEHHHRHSKKESKHKKHKKKEKDTEYHPFKRQQKKEKRHHKHKHHHLEAMADTR